MILLKSNFVFNKLKEPFGYLCGDILNKAIPFIILPIVANYIPIDKYGVYSTEVIIFSFFCNFLCMGLQAKIIVDVVRKKIVTEDVCSNVIVTFILSSFIFLVVFYIVKCFFLSSEVNLTIIFFCAFIQSFINIFITKYQANRNVKSFVLVNISYTLAYFIALLYSLFYNSWNNVWPNILISYSILSVLFIIKCFFYHEVILNKKYISTLKVKDSFIFGLYQLPHVLSSWVRLGYDRLILAGLLSMTVVGGYSAALQVCLISSVVYQSLNKFWTPFFIRKLDEKTNVKMIITLGAGGVILIAIINILFGYVYFNVFLPSNYMDFYNIVPIICIAYMFQGLYFLIVNYIYHYDFNKLISIPSVGSIVVHIIVAPLAIKYLGYYGAAISLLVSWFSLFIITILLVFYIKRERNE
ncbi:lipopolysaccharide biosynthesis protein [Photobacterium leiognathi]|uniref:lipopolysaccharide biosynthesis protein n=1 Tax=Photobacterium leiognathi TaxID=553611 RepID=UPI0029816CAC|nr:oligosaccharide flippase family protein [Photobacterium leiognathi]